MQKQGLSLDPNARAGLTACLQPACMLPGQQVATTSSSLAPQRPSSSRAEGCADLPSVSGSIEELRSRQSKHKMANPGSKRGSARSAHPRHMQGCKGPPGCEHGALLPQAAMLWSPFCNWIHTVLHTVARIPTQAGRPFRNAQAARGISISKTNVPAVPNPPLTWFILGFVC